MPTQNDRKQNKVFAIGFSLIILVILVLLLKPVVSNWKNRGKVNDEQKANAEILKAPSIVAGDLYQKIQNGSKMKIIDISTADDFARGHIAASLNSSKEKLDKGFFSEIGADAGSDIVIVNQGSDLVVLATAVNRVTSQGFANTKYLRGGIGDWKKNGFPLVSSGVSENDNAKVKKISIDEIKNESAVNPDILQFLDVRNKELFSKEHIVGAINIPLAELESRRNEISLLKKNIVYGSDKNDSFQAAVKLFDLNFFNVYEMQGSIEDWKSAGGIMQ